MTCSYGCGPQVWIRAFDVILDLAGSHSVSGLRKMLTAKGAHLPGETGRAEPCDT